MFEQFGAKPSKEDLKRYAGSPNWNGKAFQNIEKTEMKINMGDVPGLIFNQFFKNRSLGPSENLPVLSANVNDLESRNPLQAVWYGHSAVFLHLSGFNILIDPMLGDNAAPISPFPVKRFSTGTLGIINTLPQIDFVLLTHGHYDHLDYKSIIRLKEKTGLFLVAMGVKRHLVKWGIDPHKVMEFDWWNQYSKNGLTVTFTPGRHFAGRSFNDRNKALWGGWALKTPEENIWFSGDSGYGNHFKQIGDRLEPFDFGMIECGQYSKLWPLIHMFPEEGIRAALDAGVRMAMPIHWGAFTISQHQWKEPVERFVSEAHKRGVEYLTPQLGQLFDLHSSLNEEWWQQYK